MIKAVILALDADLQQFSQFLRAQGIQHRINEESGEQVVWVHGEREAEFVRLVLRDWEKNQLILAQAQPLQAAKSSPAWHNTVWRMFRESPISIILIFVCIAVALVSELGTRADRVSLLFYPRTATDGVFALLGDLGSLEVLAQSLTPMFLHFGELHLVFNMLWLWYFGRQLEPVHPAWLFLALTLVLSFTSNTAQYLYSNSNNFGGMSGVVYGLVGYTWVIHKCMPQTRLQLNNNTFLIFVVALVIMEVLASSWIASAAHVGGLVSGLVFGVFIVIYFRFFLGRSAIHKLILVADQ